MHRSHCPLEKPGDRQQACHRVPESLSRQQAGCLVCLSFICFPTAFATYVHGKGSGKGGNSDRSTQPSFNLISDIGFRLNLSQSQGVEFPFFCMSRGCGQLWSGVGGLGALSAGLEDGASLVGEKQCTWGQRYRAWGKRGLKLSTSLAQLRRGDNCLQTESKAGLVYPCFLEFLESRPISCMLSLEFITLTWTMKKKHFSLKVRCCQARWSLLIAQHLAGGGRGSGVKICSYQASLRPFWAIRFSVSRKQTQSTTKKLFIWHTCVRCSSKHSTLITSSLNWENFFRLILLRKIRLRKGSHEADLWPS